MAPQIELWHETAFMLLLAQTDSEDCWHLWLDWFDDKGDMHDQVPMPIDPQKARIIAQRLIDWADSIDSETRSI